MGGTGDGGGHGIGFGDGDGAVPGRAQGRRGGLWSAAPFLVVASVRNRIRAQFKRLKNPKYLVAMAAGAAYLWLVFFRRMFGGLGRPREALPTEWLGLIEGVMAVGALLVVLSAWVLGSNRSALRYSEAEIQFLFAGPVSRRQILHYKLLRSLAQTFFSALITTLIFGRNLAGHPAYFVVGSFLALGALGLHATGASLTRESLAGHGRYGLSRRLLTLLAVASVLGGLAWWGLRTQKPIVPAELDKDAWLAYLGALLESGPLRVLLWPFRAPVQVMLAVDAHSFWRALPGGVAVLAANYLWVLSSDHAFEEASLQVSEAWARRVEAWRGGRRHPPTLKTTPFKIPLAPVGRPEVALAWKAVASLRRMFQAGLIPLLLALTFTIGVSVYSVLRTENPGTMVMGAALAAMFGVIVALGGPGAAAVDLRRDLQALDVLKSLPLSGRQVVVGELLGPWLALAILQSALYLLAQVLLLGDVPGFPLGMRVAVTLAAILIGPAVTLLALCLINAAVLFFPAWVSTERRVRGIEAMGQRLLTLAGGLLVLSVGLAPAAAIGGGIALLLSWGLHLGAAAIPIGALFAGAVLYGEAALAIHGMGGLFERLDITE